jgi:predicted O-methyltransferase YrrM
MLVMDKNVESVLAEYEARMVEEDKLRPEIPSDEWLDRRDEFLISVGRHTGVFLNILAKASKARNILELGTSYGYSTVWLAEAARATGGKVITLEIKSEKQQYARAMLQKAGLDAHVDFRLGEARELLASLKGSFDFVLLDLWKELYIPCLDLFYPKLSKGAFIAADNMLIPEFSLPDAQAYRSYVRSKPNIESVLLPVGSGIELSRLADPLSS